MIYRTYTPGPPLANFVAFLWLYECDSHAHAKERRLPTGTMDLATNLRGDTFPVYDRGDPDRGRRFRGAVLSGIHTEYRTRSIGSSAG